MIPFVVSLSNLPFVVSLSNHAFPPTPTRSW